MPILQRIEISNFLNSKRENPWRPDWPHQVFEINGENAALNIPNGKGKSTMSAAILSMLAWHSKSLKDIRTRFFAPLRTGHYTHIRIQALIPLPGGGGNDLVTQAGGEVGGQPMVFGMYGYSGENEKMEFYGYQGVFEDCPVAHVHNLHHTLVADDAFLGQQKTCSGLFPSNAKERTKRAWLAYVEDFFDMASVRQQLNYQLMRGAEGGHGYFEVKPPVGMNYSAAVFYERLAPELLADVMGDLGEEGEHGIEDTIHEKVSKIIGAKHETSRKTEELRRAGNTLRELDGLMISGAKLKEAKKTYDSHLEGFSVEFAVLRDVLLDRPIPGVPRIPPENVPEIAKSMVMQEGKWFLPDRVMAEFTGEPASEVNRRAQDRNGLLLEQTNRTQVIDFPCHLKNRDARGNPSRLYSRDSTLGLIKITSNFTGGWTRESALEDLTRSFDWVEAHGDTNPARALMKNLDAEFKSKDTERQRLTDLHKEHQKEKESLLTEQSMVGEQQAEWRRMSNSDLFSEEDMKSPAQAGERALQAKKEASQALDGHKSRMERLAASHEAWQAFLRDRGDSILPSTLAAQLTSDKESAASDLKAAEEDLKNARGLRKGLETAKNDAASKLRMAKDRLKRFGETAPAALRFSEVFGDASPEGMAVRVGKEKDEANKSLSAIRIERGRYADSLASLAVFRAAQGLAEPSEWLESQAKEWDRLGAKIKELKEDLEDASIRRAGLDKAAVAPGKVTREAALAAGGDHRPLHAAIESMALEAERKEKALTLFSALLHAPVYGTIREALEAAERLEKAGIEAPVFASHELESFCQTGEISMEAAGAHTWLVGIRTRQVDCLLDPSLVEREKTLEDLRILELGRSIEKTTGERAKHSAESKMAAFARKAREALNGSYESKDAELESRQKGVEESLPDLEFRASPEMIQAIQGAAKHQKDFGQVTEASLREAEGLCEKDASDTAKKYTDNEEAIGGFEKEQSRRNSAMIAANEAASQVRQLLQIQAYIDHPEDNPAFMESAKETLGVLGEGDRVADERTRFRFGDADLFVMKGAERPREIEERLKDLKLEMDAIQDRLLPDLSKRIEAIQEERLDRSKDIRDIDEFVRDLLRGYREYAGEQEELVAVSREQIESRSIGGAAIGLREETSLKDLTRMLIDLAGDGTGEGASRLREAMREARSKHAGARAEFANLVDRVLVTKDLDMTEHVQLELERSKERPAIVERLHAAAQSNFEKNQVANNKAREYLDAEWGNIAAWLKSFTQRLPDNLATMKRIFGPAKDEVTRKNISAGFEIEAQLADQSDIKAVLEEVVSLVEKHEGARMAIESAAPNLRDQATKGIREEIRNTFYRKVITNPRIKAYMPSISPSSLPLEKNMVSTGQGIAMTLLWIVKMADYVTERELRRVTTSRAQQKHLHPTQFAIMDGAFSSLSNKGLIKDALDSIKRTRGRFQLIITGHDENYQNNFEYFPTLITAREINGQFMYADGETRRILQPEEAGSHYGAMGVMNLRIRPRLGGAAAEVA